MLPPGVGLLEIEEIIKMENKIYAYWLCSAPSVGNRTIEKLQEKIGAAEKRYYLTRASPAL